MSSATKNWAFLPDAWKYALVLAGTEHAATALLSETLKSLSQRLDLWDMNRTRRLLFSSLYRQGLRISRVKPSDSSFENRLLPFHELEEPGRSALVLLYLGLFSSEHLALLLGYSESELANILSRARAALAKQLALLT